MPRTDLTRELSLARLALEHGFVDEAAMQSALRAWLDWPDDSLLDQLMLKGQLTPDQRKELEMLWVDQSPEVEDASTTKWSPEPLVPPAAMISTKVDDRGASDTSLDFEGTIQHTSAMPAPIVAGKNDERFHIVSDYAQGALGEVFIAQDTQLGRMVALKQIKARYADDADARARFLLEAQITGRLEHPGIVPVYALGFDPSGRPHYAMRFIEGESLLEVVARFHNKFSDPHTRQGERLLELRKLLARFVVVCQTMDYAHSRGILHRDIKPANIMLGKYGETLLVDWGLAKIVGGGNQQQIVYQEIAGAEGLTPTAKGTAIGTPAYMSPEQALGNIDEMGPRTDVYSLGVTLYHILTGRLPREEGSVSGVLEQIKTEEFQPPSAHCSWLPKALESICLKATATRAEDRYASAAMLADEVERWLAGEPVSAHAPTLGERLCSWLRRRY